MSEKTSSYLRLTAALLIATAASSSEALADRHSAPTNPAAAEPRPQKKPKDMQFGDFANSSLQVPEYEELNDAQSIAKALSSRPTKLDLRFLAYFHDKVTRQDLELLHRPEALGVRDLLLDKLQLRDDDLQPILHLPLKGLSLRGNPVRDLHLIAGLKSLTFLDVAKTELDNKGVKVITALPNLGILNVCNTQIDDADFDSIMHMKKLGVIYVLHCPNLSKAAIQKARKEYPKRSINI